MPIYLVQSLKGTAADPAPKARLIKAARLSQVESYLICEVSIEKATPEETHALAKQGIEVEETEV